VNKKVFGNMNDKEFVKSLEKAHKWQKSYASAEEIPDSELPESFDLRNIDGYDFTGAVRNQGHCGSCYTFAFVSAIESRLRMKYGKVVP
jgi:C1A family cysteine protease